MRASSIEHNSDIVRYRRNDGIYFYHLMVDASVVVPVSTAVTHLSRSKEPSIVAPNSTTVDKSAS